MSSLRDCMLKCSEKILGLRDDMGAIIHEVFIIERTWSGERVGDGSFTDTQIQIKPTPQIMDYAHDVRGTESGFVKAGDLILKGISRSKYPNELTLRTDTDDKRIQRLYKVGEHFYHLVHIKEKFITWDVHIRKIRQDETERRR